MRGPADQASGERLAVAAADVDARQRSGHRVEARRVDDRVELDLAGGRADAGRRDALDGRLCEVDEVHVGAVERGVVAGVDAQALAPDHLGGREAGRDLRVVDGLGDALAHELGRRLVGVRVEEEVVVRAEEREPASLPAIFERGAPRVVVDRERRHVVGRAARAEGGRHLPARGAQLWVVGLDRRLLLGVERPVVRRHRVRRGALEDGELGGLLGHDRDRLDGGRPRADDAHSQAGEVDALVGPAPRVVARPRERVGAVDARDVGGRQAASVAMTTNCAVTSSPRSVRTRHDSVASSKCTESTLVSSWMSRRRSKRSATCSA